MWQHHFMMCLLSNFHDQIHGSQFKTTFWVFMSNSRWEPTQSTDPVTSPQRQPGLPSPAPLLTFPAWPQGGGCQYPGLGTQNLAKEVSRAEGAEVGPPQSG